MLVLISLAACYSPLPRAHGLAPAHRPSPRQSPPRSSLKNILMVADVTSALQPLSEWLSGPSAQALLASPNTYSLVGAAVGAVVIARWPSRGPLGAPYPPKADAYDPTAANEYYRARLPAVVSRLARLGALTFVFNMRLLLDLQAYKRAGSPEGEAWPNEAARAKEALALATQLGPTFIKLAQALSIRTDLIPEAYALELRQLQDAVPPFDSDEAREIIAAELRVSGGATRLSIFTTISDKPLASASIGQVYKATLRDGREVAVKVQRPQILDAIALDLYLLRLLAPLQTRVSNFINRVPTYPADLRLAQELVDEWGRGFVAETDYLYEAANTRAFREAMERRGLGAVTSPAVVEELSTPRVLVTEWVDGTRLDLDASPDVPRLCGVAINAYLTMLLDTGVLHCDPHPGNLLRTKDGKLCILDWGMTQNVPEDLQYSLIEFIAHVNAEDYDAMPEDFVKLGFTPPDQLERVRASNLTEGLSFVLRQLSQGGGGKKLQARVRDEWREKYDPDGTMSTEELREKVREDFYSQARKQLEADGIEGASVMDVQNVMEKMQQRNRELFKVPPYILYVARAFSTLEGIGLSANEDYSIVSEAYPYLSKRLLTDKSPRARAALRSMVYGSGDRNSSNSSPSFAKLLSMGEGFTSYSVATSSVPMSAAPDPSVSPSPRTRKGGKASEEGSAPHTDDAQEELIDLLLSADGNYVQELLLEEAAKVTDAAVRDTIAQAGNSAAAAAIANALRAPKRFADSTIGRLPLPGPLKSGLQLALLPATVLDEVSRVFPSLARSQKTDEEALAAFSALWEEMSKSSAHRDPAGGKARGELPSTIATVQESAGPLLQQLADPESRLRDRVPLVGTLSRRFAAILLRRVALRLEADAAQPGSPGLARTIAERAAAAERGLADFIEPPPIDERQPVP
ncbi:hypothetical protein AB1Y20_000948 [Prymnesium parvum]|uniref:ABC1 atypical kinase-like domain-containing protein n=1 Tax=Prymnesium parvum TaxID=97485 RepID=A0AB34KA70_PRYPA|mmetsp:Transcript_42667/g.106186  ORF Transcript_42667/g.106186 Transcript_42667/m.106186 type:complete len:918 (+) Transcript_42667:220-2973(+)